MCCPVAVAFPVCLCLVSWVLTPSHMILPFFLPVWLSHLDLFCLVKGQISFFISQQHTEGLSHSKTWCQEVKEGSPLDLKLLWTLATYVV